MSIADAKFIKNINRTVILEEIIKNEPISRSDLAKITGLNKVTISSQIASLIEEKLLIEKKAENSPGSSGGKKPILLFINKKSAYSLGLEFKKNAISSILTDLHGDIVYKENFSIKKTNLEYIIDKIETIYDHYFKKLKNPVYGIIGISIGIHGKIDKNSLIIECNNLKWKNINLKKELIKKFPDLIINIKNNNQFSVLAEKSAYNVSKDSFIYLNMSAGVGSGIVIDNNILEGTNGLSGEVGHLSIELNGRKCYCGRKGCWETYSCERAFLKDLSTLKNKNVTFEKFEKLLAEKDKTTLSFFPKYEDYMISGLLSIINIFDPKLILMHNRIFDVHPPLLKNLKKKLSKCTKVEIDIRLSTQKDLSCCLGACISNILEFLNINSLKLKEVISE